MDIKSMYLTELESFLKEKGYPTFRAKQLYQWLHEKHVGSLDDMTNIPKTMKEDIKEAGFVTIEEETRQESAKDGTIKFLYRMQDGQMIETVFMRYSYGNSICISSQAGCRMGCKFCASTIGGLIRNLTASEMLEQVYMTMRLTGERISNIVVMGTGEPLDNYDNVLRFLSLITDEQGQNMSMRHISLSTCGVVPGIYDLMEKDLQLTLSVSLHAPSDEIRSSMMPVNRKWNVDELLTACRKYTDKTRRRISFEYAMVSGVNDSDDCARLLAKKLRGILCHVNLIPVNEVKETGCKRSSRERIESFSHILEKSGFAVTVRRKLGSDINASCGQLRRSNKKQ